MGFRSAVILAGVGFMLACGTNQPVAPTAPSADVAVRSSSLRSSLSPDPAIDPVGWPLRAELRVSPTRSGMLESASAKLIDASGVSLVAVDRAEHARLDAEVSLAIMVILQPTPRPAQLHGGKLVSAVVVRFDDGEVWKPAVEVAIP
jgi:hypothetical protein